MQTVPLPTLSGWLQLVGLVAATVGTTVSLLWLAFKPYARDFIVETHLVKAADIKIIEAKSWEKEIANQEAVYHLAQKTAADLATHAQSFEALKREVHRHLPVITTLPTVLADLSHNIHQQRETNEKIADTLERVRDELGANRTEVAVIRTRMDLLGARHP